MFKIEKDPSKDFAILNLTDLNFDTSDWNNEQILSHFKETVFRLIELSKPDLLTISGDFARSDLIEIYKEELKFIEELNLPWAFCLGNHDNQDGYDRSLEIANLLSSGKNCLFESGPREFGVGNYVIQITENDMPIHALVLMDSHDREEMIADDGKPVNVWSRLSKKQLEWYKDTVLSMGVNTTLITHIPLYEFRVAFNKAFNDEFEPASLQYDGSFDSKYWNDGYKGSFGVAHEGICSYPQDGREFQYIKDSKHTKLILVGHDHMNNFVIKHEGVILAYATKTGKGCYFDKDINGGTVLRINAEGVSIEHILI